MINESSKHHSEPNEVQCPTMPTPGSEYYHQGYWYDGCYYHDKFWAFSKWEPTEFFFEETNDGRGMWYNPGPSYEDPPAGYTNPITVKVWDEGYGRGYPWYYNACYDQNMGQYEYYDQHGCLQWVSTWGS